ncbi:malate synthase A [Streptomyces sp. CB01881]|uniref:malate synthase A n=1 Tax=Streptomyces sp. CB01881 TaxID=2078691 RepID=UPI000CDBBDC4|nr:malate synthase A [Streptomyces sp. CB01881]AUY53588.1 malate synthase A [Streptomyces sp. CB01881]TYC69733.1 malate synthase A [Streptomyces sp. CB01881]
MSHPSRIEVLGEHEDRFDEILTPEALAFLTRLHDRFARRRTELLAERDRRRAELAAGATLDFRPESRAVREDLTWRVAGAGPGLVDRRVEITGPPERRMTVNALNSGARVWLADFEDATSPTWHNLVSGQLNLVDAIERRIDDTTPEGRRYRVGDTPATIVVRPRGWHLDEQHLLIDGRPAVGALVDFGLYLFHCGRLQIERGSGPYFYLPKLENHLEARLWNDVFTFAQAELGIPHGTVRATVLIETITAAFEMEEILHELRDHAAGLNAGRWDYLFSLIKNLAHRGPRFVLPDRATLTMTQPFMRAYTDLLVRTCHRRGAHAIGGMAAAIPQRDPAANEAALTKVRADKEREAGDGFDGSWVAHPALVATCRTAFDAVLGDRPHQLDRTREDVEVTAADLLAVHRLSVGLPTEQGVRSNVAVALRYLVAWLDGSGAVAVFGLMEDVATAEIARCQIWQWQHHCSRLAGGSLATADLVRRLIDRERATLLAEGSDLVLVDDAVRILEDTAFGADLPAFLTTGAYARHLVRIRTAA